VTTPKKALKPAMAIEALLETTPPKMAIDTLLPRTGCESEALGLSTSPFGSTLSLHRPEELRPCGQKVFKAVEQRKDAKSSTVRPDGTQVRAKTQRQQQEIFTREGNCVRKRMVEHSHTRKSKSGGFTVTDSMKTVEVNWM